MAEAAIEEYNRAMWSRSFAAFCCAVWLMSLGAGAAEESCICSSLEAAPKLIASHADRLQFHPEHFRHSDYSSFRGLSLLMNRTEAKAALQKVGFELASYHTDAMAMDICSGKTGVGIVRFDVDGTINKLELSPLYFAVSKIHVREFADKLFAHYKVRPAVNADDICFHDVTCFRGTTLSEKLLILRIGHDLQFHIMPRRPPSDVTQRN
jgi:hypothetical protein